MTRTQISVQTHTHTHSYSHTMSTSATGVDSCPPCGQFFVCHLVSFLFCKVDIKFIAPPGRKQSVCECVCVCSGEKGNIFLRQYIGIWCSGILVHNVQRKRVRECRIINIQITRWTLTVVSNGFCLGC